MDLNGAVAVAQPQPGAAFSAASLGASAADAVAEPQSEGAPSPTAVSSVALETVDPYGQVRPAIVSGSANVKQFIVGPNGNVYVLFASAVNLDDTTLSGTCQLAEVDPSTGVPTCVDNTLSSIMWQQPSSGRNPAIQFDGAGAVYYSANTWDGHTVLRKYADGTVTDLINQNIYLHDFLVLSDGGVLLTGRTTSTGASWLRYRSPTGSLQGLAGVQSNFLKRFPDGNVYTGVWGTGNFGVRRFLTSTNQLEGKYWITSTIGDASNAYYKAEDFGCPSPLRYSFCGWAGSYIQDSFTTDDGKVYAIAGGQGQGGLLMQYFPTVQVGKTAVQRIFAAQSVGSDLVLAGLDSNDRNITNFYDTATGLEAPVFGPANEIEIYHLTYVPETHKMLFDGLRFSDNKYVLGEIDFT
jgi:hypothetical protein